jgi:IclR family acetate operon transcriptional repressor
VGIVDVKASSLRSANSVQSLDRAVELIGHLAALGGEASIAELAHRSGLPSATIHRILRTLLNQGYARQEPSRRYALGPALIQLGELASRKLGSWARPILADVVRETGETASLAALDGDEAVFVAQRPSKHSVRMFTDVGSRPPLHATGIGKALLSALPDGGAQEILQRTGLAACTPNTIVDLTHLLDQLTVIRRRGYAVDDGEEELGVRCLAVPVPGVARLMAISVSGPAARLGRDVETEVVRVLKIAATRLADTLANGPSQG